MELFNKSKITAPFFFLALALLATGLLFGLTGGLQYIIPGFLRNSFSFEKVRPLHVSSVVFWIITAAMGAVLYYLQEHTGRKLRYPLLVKVQFALFALAFTGILISYVYGIFGGREYWEFHPLFSIPILAGWILFMINFLSSIGSFRKQPVYIWMWITGLVFFLFTYMESNLWLFPYFRNNIILDMTIQWKSYGSMVGSWNMLIYGSSIYLIDKIAGNKKYSYSNIAFSLYFLGLFNLMFNWGHHIYTLPTYGYVKHIGYLVSMTELFLIGRILYLWRDSLSTAKKHIHNITYKFIIAADVWVFITLALAIFMSVPAFNVYMHGTHVVVGHTMGATIGINSMLLLAFIYDISANTCSSFVPFAKIINRGYRLMQYSLPVFFLSLVIAGFLKSKWQMTPTQVPFGTMMLALKPWFIGFVTAGIFLITGFLLVIYPAFVNLYSCYFKSQSVKSKKYGVHKPVLSVQ